VREQEYNRSWIVLVSVIEVESIEREYVGIGSVGGCGEVYMCSGNRPVGRGMLGWEWFTAFLTE
jgi:hypothetical protein